MRTKGDFNRLHVPVFHFAPRHKYGCGSGKHELINSFLTSTPEGTDVKGRFSNTKPKSIQQWQSWTINRNDLCVASSNYVVRVQTVQ